MNEFERNEVIQILRKSQKGGFKDGDKVTISRYLRPRGLLNNNFDFPPSFLQIFQIVDNMTYQLYKRNQFMCHLGTQAQNLIMLIKGKATIFVPKTPLQLSNINRWAQEYSQSQKQLIEAGFDETQVQSSIDRCVRAQTMLRLFNQLSEQEKILACDGRYRNHYFLNCRELVSSYKMSGYVENDDYLGFNLDHENPKRTFTSICTDDTDAIIIKASLFKDIMDQNKNQVQVTKRILNQEFPAVPDEEIIIIAYRFCERVIERNDYLFFEFDNQMRNFFILFDGRMKAQQKNQKNDEDNFLEVLTVGSLFGHEDIIIGAKRRSYSAKALATCLVLQFKIDELLEIGDSIPVFLSQISQLAKVRYNFYKDTLKQIGEKLNISYSRINMSNSLAKIKPIQGQYDLQPQYQLKKSSNNNNNNNIVASPYQQLNFLVGMIDNEQQIARSSNREFILKPPATDLDMNFYRQFSATQQTRYQKTYDLLTKNEPPKVQTDLIKLQETDQIFSKLHQDDQPQDNESDEKRTKTAQVNSDKRKEVFYHRGQTAGANQRKRKNSPEIVQQTSQSQGRKASGEKDELIKSVLTNKEILRRSSRNNFSSSAVIIQDPQNTRNSSSIISQRQQNSSLNIEKQYLAEIQQNKNFISSQKSSINNYQNQIKIQLSQQQADLIAAIKTQQSEESQINNEAELLKKKSDKTLVLKRENAYQRTNQIPHFLLIGEQQDMMMRRTMTESRPRSILNPNDDIQNRFYSKIRKKSPKKGQAQTIYGQAFSFARDQMKDRFQIVVKNEAEKSPSPNRGTSPEKLEILNWERENIILTQRAKKFNLRKNSSGPLQSKSELTKISSSQTPNRNETQIPYSIQSHSPSQRVQTLAESNVTSNVNKQRSLSSDLRVRQIYPQDNLMTQLLNVHRMPHRQQYEPRIVSNFDSSHKPQTTITSWVTKEEDLMNSQPKFKQISPDSAQLDRENGIGQVLTDENLQSKYGSYFQKNYNIQAITKLRNSPDEIDGRAAFFQKYCLNNNIYNNIDYQNQQIDKYLYSNQNIMRSTGFALQRRSSSLHSDVRFVPIQRQAANFNRDLPEFERKIHFQKKQVQASIRAATALAFVIKTEPTSRKISYNENQIYEETERQHQIDSFEERQDKQKKFNQINNDDVLECVSDSSIEEQRQQYLMYSQQMENQLNQHQIENRNFNYNSKMNTKEVLISREKHQIPPSTAPTAATHNQQVIINNNGYSTSNSQKKQTKKIILQKIDNRQ